MTILSAVRHMLSIATYSAERAVECRLAQLRVAQRITVRPLLLLLCATIVLCDFPGSDHRDNFVYQSLDRTQTLPQRTKPCRQRLFLIMLSGAALRVSRDIPD